MAVTKCSCPSCGVTLRLATPADPRKALKCPKCGEGFHVPSETPTNAKPQPRATAANLKVDKVDADKERAEDQPPLRKVAKKQKANEIEEPDDDQPQPRKRAKNRKGAKQNYVVLIRGLAGGLVLLVLIGVGSLLAIGVFRGKGASLTTKPDVNPTKPDANPTKPDATLGPDVALGMIELSNPEAAIIAKNINGQDYLFLNWKVKYRFTQGQSQPQDWYACSVTDSSGIGGTGIQQVAGQDLKAEGVFEAKSGLFAGKELPKSLTFVAMQGKTKGAYKKISTEVSCPVKARADIEPTPPKTTPEQEAVVAKFIAQGVRITRAGNQPDGAPEGVVVQGKKLADLDLAALKKMPHLLGLVISSAQATNADLANLKDLTTLKVLVLNDNPGVTDLGLAHLKGLTNLEELTLIDLGISDAGLVHLVGVRKLHTLHASCPMLGDAGMTHLQTLRELLFLDLSGTHVTDAGLAQLKGLTKLQILLLEATSVTNAGLVHLKSMTKLTTLRVVQTQVTEAGAKELQKTLPNVQVVLKDQ
jgi:hypothetical protein